MKKVLIFKQPYPMGNYKLNNIIAEFFDELGWETYVLEQLNGRKPNDEYIQQILDLDPDLLYTEMLDAETFKIVEQLKCEKILLYASKGILNRHEDIVNYYGKWFDKIITNSQKMHDFLIRKRIPSMFFTYYFSVLEDADLISVDKYMHDCTFLGMGYGRITSIDYDKDRRIFFSNFDRTVDYKIYGVGWPNYEVVKGPLPPDDIGKLYSSANSGVAIIGKSQRQYGQINNRYTEMAFAGIPIITINYSNVDWFGAESYLNFVNSNTEFYDTVKNILSDSKIYLEKSLQFRKFIETKHHEFFHILNNLIGE